jgi:DNA/RNA-binding domain of Phe-tRNA-synthetase-like protein
MTIAIDAELAARGVRPGLGLLAGSLDDPPDPAGLGAALAAVAARLDGRQPSVELPALAATRRAIKALGKDPARYRPSAEALLRRLARDRQVPRIAPVVDVGTLVSLETGVSVGIHDRDRLVPPLSLRAGRAGERYESVDGRLLELAGLPLLVDGSGPVGGPVRDGARAKVRTDSRRILVVLYGFWPVPIDVGLLERAAARFRALAGLVVAEAALVPGP